MPPKRSGSWFETTRWHIVLAAGSAATPASREALAVLCEQYWYPLYAYLRRVGHDASDAEDLTQGFFLRLLEKDALHAADPKRGRFRSFLLTALKHFAANEWDRRRAMKRGGTHPPVSFDLSTGEDRYRLEPRDNSTTEAVYERQWALTLLNRTISRLRAEFRGADKEALFNHLQPYVSPGATEPPYAETAVAAGMTIGAVKVAVHRLRRRYRDVLREEIAQTVASPDDIDDEIHRLITIVGR
jgi:RNA polymerase sigma-70 factor (ECF subfamily)